MTPTRRIVTLAAVVALSGCADSNGAGVATGSVSTAASPSSASLPSLAEYVSASEAWQEALTRFFMLTPSGGQVNEEYLDGAERVLSDVESKFTDWWSLAEPVAEMAGGSLERDARRYAAKYRRWDEIQRRFLTGYRECLPISGSGEETAACLRTQGLDPALREHFTLTDWLRSHTGTIIELLMFSPAFQ
jgi:hypothetical protein